jgi:hypothetical protein
LTSCLLDLSAADFSDIQLQLDTDPTKKKFLSPQTAPGNHGPATIAQLNWLQLSKTAPTLVLDKTRRQQDLFA